VLSLLVALCVGSAASQGPTPPVPPVEPTVPEPTLAKQDAGVSPSASAHEAPPPPLPPALSGRALCDELAQVDRSGAARSRLDEERKTLARERSKLEALAADIAQSRQALKEETTRLERLVAKSSEAPHSPAADGSVPGPTGKADVESLGKAIKAMKPEAAAGLIARMDSSLAAAVLRSLRPATVGAVLERLKPETAAALAAQLSRGGASGGNR
jgi:flagellar motility protein MotE (MotC chaperone)